MYIDKNDIFVALTKMVGNFDQKMKTNLSVILLQDGDVDDFDNTTRIRMASTIDAMLVNMTEAVSDLQEWSQALKGENSGEVDELSRRAGL